MAKFLKFVLLAPEVQPLLSFEHSSVDSSLLWAWTSHSALERIDHSTTGRHRLVMFSHQDIE
jgi:hypothetical protein